VLVAERIALQAKFLAVEEWSAKDLDHNFVRGCVAPRNISTKVEVPEVRIRRGTQASLSIRLQI
jgi:hypothetical protein